MQAPLKASKWLTHHALFNDIKPLLSRLSPVKIAVIGKVVDRPFITPSELIEAYQDYKQALLESRSLPKLAFALTRDESAIQLMPVKDRGVIARIVKPVVEMRSHHFIISNGEFHSMAFGKEAISWGVKFAYPQIYQGENGVVDLFKSDHTENTDLYKELSRALRDLTKPTPFLINEQLIKSTIRIDPQTFSWIDTHPGLKEVSVAH